jgi:hypothetical protein
MMEDVTLSCNLITWQGHCYLSTMSAQKWGIQKERKAWDLWCDGNSEPLHTRGCHSCSENGEWENGEWENGEWENGEWGKREANRIASPWRKVWHPFVACGEWRMENENYHCRPHVVRIYVLFTNSDLKSVVSSIMHFCSVDSRWKKQPQVKNSKTFFILHSSPVEEKKFSPFSILREWALRHSKRVWHIPILHSPRIGRKRCDNPYYGHPSREVVWLNGQSLLIVRRNGLTITNNI